MQDINGCKYMQSVAFHSSLVQKTTFRCDRLIKKEFSGTFLVGKQKLWPFKVCCSKFPSKSRLPLTKREEHECFADVQDLCALQKKKAELESKLGRVATYQEWADHVGCSICHLYARVGKGRAAKRKMVAANLPLVSSIAKQYHGRGLSHQDLCQEGAMALMKSTEKFDVSHNVKFSTYSYYWIRERMGRATQYFQSIWMVGKLLRERVIFILRCKDEFCKQNGRNPSLDELSLASNIDKMKIRQAIFAIRSIRTRMWNRMYADDKVDFMEAEDSKSDLSWTGIWQNELRAELQVLLEELSPREVQVLKMRYGLYGGAPLSLVQIADMLDLTHEAVRKSEKNAFKKLRMSAEKNGLQHYLTRIENQAAF